MWNFDIMTLILVQVVAFDYFDVPEIMFLVDIGKIQQMPEHTWIGWEIN
jgi:hypothetical protein